MFSLGGIQLLYTADPKLVKAVRVFRSLDLGKPAYLQKERGALLGKGLITANGGVWSHERKTISPHLYMGKIKVGVHNEHNHVQLRKIKFRTLMLFELLPGHVEPHGRIW